jgi:hypothetical protein
VTKVMRIFTERVWLAGKLKQQLVVRSLLCYWSESELGERMTALGKWLDISTAAVSNALQRSDKIVENQELKFKN